MITHSNLVATIASCNAYLALYNETLGVDDCYFSFLPLAHVFDRVAEEFMLSKGGSIGYWQGEIPKVSWAWWREVGWRGRGLRRHARYGCADHLPHQMEGVAVLPGGSRKQRWCCLHAGGCRH
jgi:hypothetical protein